MMKSRNDMMAIVMTLSVMGLMVVATELEAEGGAQERGCDLQSLLLSVLARLQLPPTNKGGIFIFIK